MALGSIQPLTEISTRNLPGDKGRLVRKADKFNAIYEPIVYKMWEPRRLTTLWAFTACYRDSFTFFLSKEGFVAQSKYYLNVFLDRLLKTRRNFILNTWHHLPNTNLHLIYQLCEITGFTLRSSVLI
jgi:hypothetical protein